MYEYVCVKRWRNVARCRPLLTRAAFLCSCMSSYVSLIQLSSYVDHVHGCRLSFSTAVLNHIYRLICRFLRASVIVVKFARPMMNIYEETMNIYRCLYSCSLTWRQSGHWHKNWLVYRVRVIGSLPSITGMSMWQAIHQYYFKPTIYRYEINRRNSVTAWFAQASDSDQSFLSSVVRYWTVERTLHMFVLFSDIALLNVGASYMITSTSILMKLSDTSG